MTDDRETLSAEKRWGRGVCIPGLCLAILWLLAGMAIAQEDPLEQQRDAAEESKLLLIRIDGPILPGSAAAGAAREIERWLENDPAIEFVLLRLDTPGGEAQTSMDLANFIFGLKGVVTIAWVPPGKQALSGGTFLALAAQKLVMGRGGTIGAAAPVQQTPFGFEELGEKIQSVLRSQLTEYAAARGYPVALTKAMVSKNHPDILRVTFSRGGAGAENPKHEFMTQSDYDNLPPEKRTLARGREVVLHKGELFVARAEIAADYGFAAHQADSLTDVLLAMGINIPEENLIDARSGPMKATSPAGQALVDLLNNAFVRFLLIVGGTLGLLLELKMLGAMVPGLIGLSCFVAFFAGSLFPLSGSLIASATIWEVLVFPLGLALIAVELFAPGVAIFALSGAALCIASLVLSMVAPDAASEGHMDLEDAIIVLVFGFGAGSAAFLLLLRYLPRSSFFARRGLVSHTTIQGVPTARSRLDAQQRSQEIVGELGVALTALHPAGKVELDGGMLIDVVTGGEFVGKGDRVRVTESSGGRTVVEPAEVGSSDSP